MSLEEQAFAQSVFSLAQCPATQGTTETHDCLNYQEAKPALVQTADKRMPPFDSLNPNLFTLIHQNQSGVYTELLFS